MAHSADNLTGTDPCIQRFYPPYQAAGDSSKQWLIGPLPTLCDIEWWHFGATGLPQILGSNSLGMAWMEPWKHGKTRLWRDWKMRTNLEIRKVRPPTTYGSLEQLVMETSHRGLKFLIVVQKLIHLSILKHLNGWEEGTLDRNLSWSL
jgi:hypothetical protein